MPRVRAGDLDLGSGTGLKSGAQHHSLEPGTCVLSVSWNFTTSAPPGDSLQFCLGKCASLDALFIKAGTAPLSTVQRWSRSSLLMAE